jgi:hypothetical protein
MSKKEKRAAFMIFIGTVLLALLMTFTMLIVPVILVYYQEGAPMLFYVFGSSYLLIMPLVLHPFISMEICAIQETYNLWRSNDPEILARFKEEFRMRLGG